MKQCCLVRNRAMSRRATFIVTAIIVLINRISKIEYRISNRRVSDHFMYLMFQNMRKISTGQSKSANYSVLTTIVICEMVVWEMECTSIVDGDVKVYEHANVHSARCKVGTPYSITNFIREA